ncbi:hypothetical protein QBC40DRAFT_280005 [Triangularia verruculosa]|uniref:ZZ-type domain-containing protein n=1 Tax=Triangularia verruculosa TaxID=2587418 RepID=A0AAN7ATE4_9PEZI|nr:hypothetical protein QBC40DRAFT_280005 [Triangularia verruculosa]
MYGTRYTCRECSDFDLCFKCYDRSSRVHHQDHEFIATETDEELKQVLGKGIASKEADNEMGVYGDETHPASPESEGSQEF